LLCGGPERQSASDRSAGSIERRQNAVACTLGQISAVLFDHLLRKVVVTVERLSPSLIAHCGSHQAIFTARAGEELGLAFGYAASIPARDGMYFAYEIAAKQHASRRKTLFFIRMVADRYGNRSFQRLLLPRASPYDESAPHGDGRDLRYGDAGRI
jgi:hypothetical protein